MLIQYAVRPLLVLVALTALFDQSALAADLFPDKNLEAVVRQNVFAKRDKKEPLVAADVEKLSTIKGNGKGIKNLAGLEKCVSLAALDLADNEITDLAPIAGLTKLQTLTLSKNKISNVGPLAGLTALQYLELSDNQVADLAPLAKLVKMRSLYLSNNQIKDLKPIAGLTKVWSLDLDGNQLTNLAPIAGLKAITSLYLRGNEVVDLTAVGEMTELRYLLLNGNKIVDLAPLLALAEKGTKAQRNFPRFCHVYLSGNPLSDAAKTTQADLLRKAGARLKIEDK